MHDADRTDAKIDKVVTFLRHRFMVLSQLPQKTTVVPNKKRINQARATAPRPVQILYPPPPLFLFSAFMQMAKVPRMLGFSSRV